MKTKLKNLWTRIKANAWKYVSVKDVIIIIPAILASNFVYIILTYFYPATGEPSFQWLYNTVFGVTRASIVIGYSYLIMRILFFKQFAYMEKCFDYDTQFITPWQKLRLHLFLYCFFIVVFLLSVMTM